MWDSCIQESLEIQISEDVLSTSRRRIHTSRSGRSRLTSRWSLVKEIISKKSLIRRPMNSWMLIRKTGLYWDMEHHSGRHLKTELEILNYRSRGEQRHPMEMLQASDWPTKWGHIVMRRLIRRCHVNLVEDFRSWRMCQRYLAAE